MEFYRKKLGNGLTVLFEKRNLPVVSVSASVNWGSEFETEKIKGISHFIEHLMFKGTKTREQKEIAEEIEKKGGILNAYTSEEVTSYWNKLPSRHVLDGINIASDLILNPKFDAVEFEREKNVIIEEIKMYHDNPMLHVQDKIKEMLYEKPFGLSIAGKAPTIKNAKREDIIKLFKSMYTTDSMILCVVGNANFDEICKRAEKLYPRTKRKLELRNIKEINSERIEKRKELEQAHFIFGFHAPNFSDKLRYVYDLAGCHLFEGMSSVLFQEIREKRGLAYAIRGGFDQSKNYGFGTIYVNTLKEKIKDVKEIIIKEISNLKNLNNKDFEECKEQLIGMRKVAEEDSSNVMNSLMLEELSGNANNYYKYEENINQVKLSDIKNMKIKNYSAFSLVPA
jgi:predicted Zn-dependent peptidase